MVLYISDGVTLPSCKCRFQRFEPCFRCRLFYHISFVVMLQSCHHDVHHMYTKTCGKHTEVIACVVVRRCCSVVSYGGQYSVLSG